MADRWVDRVMYELLEPERQRQRANMLSAVRTMVELTYA
jgi:hypothetical protein